MPLHTFQVRTLRDLDHAIYLLNFERIVLLAPNGEWSVYYKYPCRFLDRSEPGRYRCTIHGAEQQPQICVNYSPFSCWYRHALNPGVSDGFLTIDRRRLERIIARVGFDDQRNIVDTPDWPSLIALCAEVPLAPDEFDAAPASDPMFDQWLEVAATGLVPPPRRRRSYGDFLDACDGCGAWCCKTLVFPHARPTSRKNLDYLQFVLGFPGIEVGVSDGEWSIIVRARCRHLTDDNRCGVFGQPERPMLCRYFDATGCSYVAQFGVARPEQFMRIRLEQFFWMVDALSFRIAFNFVDDLAGAAKWSIPAKKVFAAKFMSQVRTAWSGQYQFQNVAEPQLVWKKLNPIRVSVRATESAAAPHFTATVHKKQVTDAVHGATADFSAASQTPNKNPFPGTGAAELAALQAKTPTPIPFAAGAHAIGAADLGKVQFLGTYLHSIHQPKFQLTVTGHAATDPAAVTPQQKTAAAHAAVTLSQQRANTVRDTIRAAGNAQHKLTVAAKGNTAGLAAPAGDKVEIASAVDPSYTNVQPVLPHEFGHMLGLGDEYANAAHPVGANATHYGLAKDALGQDMADSFAKITVDAEGLMQGGQDVRPTHYVTLWAALADAAATAAAPVPAFKRDDWKFVGM